MSSAANHRRRSHRSEARKGGMYSVSRHRMLFREATKQRNRNIFSRLANRLANLFHRRAPKQTEQKGEEA